MEKDGIILKVEGISKSYISSTERVTPLKNLSLTVEKGDFILIVGPSGSGKTTFLNVIAGLDKADNGLLFFAGERYDNRSDKYRTLLRRKKLGVIFQSFELVQVMTCYDNIEYPMLLQGVDIKERKRRISDVSEILGITELLKRKPEKISGGQKQRVAIARTLVGEYKCVLGDEVTGNLDIHTAERVYQRLKELNKEKGHTFVMASHNLALKKFANKVFTLVDGRLKEEI